MHGLNTIARLNNSDKLLLESITNFRRQGRHVVARYDGSSLMSIETFSTKQGADEHLAQVDTHEARSQSTRHQHFAPTN